MITTFNQKDVRGDPIGIVNRLINRIYLVKSHYILQRIISVFFHIQLPILMYPLRLPHPYGIIVNRDAKLGRNVTIYQHVTVGSKRLGRRAGTATISDNVVIYPNTVIIGDIIIGEGATIGPCSVVIDDVPAYCTVAGNPAHIIKHKDYDGCLT